MKSVTKLVSFIGLLSTTGSKIQCHKKKCRWDKIDSKKLDKLHSEKRYISKPKYGIARNIIINFSSYTLTSEEKYALSFSLNQHIPTKNNTNEIKTEF